MKRIFMNCFLLFIISICFLENIYSEDWVPNTFDNVKFEKANNAVKEYIVKNGTYLSGTNDFSFYYLNDVNISQDSIKPEKNNKFVFVSLQSRLFGNLFLLFCIKKKFITINHLTIIVQELWIIPL